MNPSRRTLLADADALRRRRRRKQRDARRRAGRRVVLLVAGAAMALVAAAGVTTAGVVFSNCNLGSLEAIKPAKNTFVYAADGSLLGAIPAEQNRKPVAIDEMSPWLRKATIAIEDRRFYDHGGIDVVGIARAAIADVRARDKVQGASTITQQFVRSLSGNYQDRSFKRKLKEACLARKLDNAWDKNRILESYLNQVFYGNNAYGVEAAAETYFAKRAAKLNLQEAALLAGLPQAPTDLEPINHAEKALERRNEVLKAMLENGDITQQEYEWASTRPLKLKPGKLFTERREPYFFSYVQDELNREYGAETVRSGGLKVYTTINPRYQRLALNAIHSSLYLSTDPAAAVVSIDPRNGAIRAMAAATPGKKGNQFNLVAQARRQAGSTFKTFALASAVEQGMDPYNTYYTSAPFHYEPVPGGEAWDVSTYSHTYLGSVSVARATTNSDNTVFAQLTLDAGPERVADMAWRLGVRQSKLPIVPSIGLGAASVSPLEMASAYATIAAGGVYSHPMAITKVVLPDGTVDTDAGWGKPKQERVIDDWVAHEVTKVLEDNMRFGTGAGAYFGRPSAGKTGTTDDHADAWFCAFLPQLSTAVWVGYPQAELPMLSVHGIAVAGATFPAQIWRLFMERAVSNLVVRDFREPRGEPHFGGFQQRRLGYTYSVTTTTETTTTSTETTSQEPPPEPVQTPTTEPQTTPEPTPTIEEPAPTTPTTEEPTGTTGA